MNESIHADKAASLADLAVSTSSGAARVCDDASRASATAAPTEQETPLAPSGNPARPLRYSLDVYWRAPSDGPLHFTWSDKPHRVVYDLVSGYAFLRASHERLERALTACLPFIDDAEDVAQLFADSAATDKCRAAVAAARAALASRSCLTCKHRNTEATPWTGNPCQGCGREPDFAKWEPAI